MAKKRIKKVDKEVIETPIMNRFGLNMKDKIRFKPAHSPDGRWIKGVVLGDEKDGSLTIFDNKGRWRAIMPENVQVQLTGPRGGKRWVPVLEREQ